MVTDRLEAFTRLVPELRSCGDGTCATVWSEGEEIALALAPAEPRTDTAAERPVLVRRARLFVPAGTRLVPGDRVRRRATGEVLEILGDPGWWQTPADAAAPFGQTDAEVIAW